MTQQTQKINKSKVDEEIQKFDDQNLANRITNKSALQIVNNNAVLQTGACMHVHSALQLLRSTPSIAATDSCMSASRNERRENHTRESCLPPCTTLIK